MSPRQPSAGNLSWVLTALLMLQISTQARADSDGYYCVNRAYLAWETRGFHRGNKHRLTLAFLDGRGSQVTLDLPEFQLHGMQCSDTAITLYGWETAHAIDIDGARAKYLGSKTVEDIASLRERWVPRRFGDTPELELRTAVADVRYVLITDLTRRAFNRGVEFTTLVRLVKLDEARNLIDSRVIFAEAVAQSSD